MDNIFSRLRRIADEVPWASFASVVAEQLDSRSAAAEEIVEQLKNWGALLTKNALSKWMAAVAVPTACESPDVSTGRPKPCRRHAVVPCDVCGRQCCLAHARVDYMGDAICEVCIGKAKAQFRAAGGVPPREEARQEARRNPERRDEVAIAHALKTLKLPKTATWVAIKAQYRKLAVKHNADRPQTEAQRLKNTERLKQIHAAYAVLREHYEKQEAA